MNYPQLKNAGNRRDDLPREGHTNSLSNTNTIHIGNIMWTEQFMCITISFLKKRAWDLRKVEKGFGEGLKRGKGRKNVSKL